jgi:hypothetical protein
MPTDFLTAARNARDAIAVPDLSMRLISAGARTAAVQERRRVLAVLGAISVVIVSAGAAFGSKIADGVRVWLSGGKAAIVVNSLVVVREPTAADVDEVIAKATFPVTFPSGLPAGTRVRMMLYAPEDHPNSITLTYSLHGRDIAGATLQDSSSIDTAETQFPGAGQAMRGDVYQWQVGRETIFIPKMHNDPAIVARIEAATMETPRSGITPAVADMLRRIVVLGGTSKTADLAERLAPPAGRSVLVDRMSIRWMLGAASRGKPLLDTRTVFLTGIPSVHGVPDYSKATLQWPKVVVLDADGVRAATAVLHATETGTDCGCALLIDAAGPAMYRVWKIIQAPLRSVEYSVDAKTMSVTRVSAAADAARS